MARILDLPNEVLHMIIDHLLRPPTRIQTWSPWPLAIPRPSHLRGTGKALSQLILANKYFYRLFQNRLYTHVALRHSNIWPNFHIFNQTLSRTPALSEHIISIYIAKPRIEDVAKLFSLPKLTTLEVGSFINPQSSLAPSPAQHHKSAIQHLYLPLCYTTATSIGELLAYPAALRSLHFNECGWEPHMNSLMRALSSQRTTLERLTFTRASPLSAEYVPNRIRAIDLSGYSVLKSLSTNHAILVGRDEPVRRDHLRMPPLLEELQVLYDEGIG